MRLASGDVVILEKGNMVGGTTAMSGGMLWIPGNHHQLAAGAVWTSLHALWAIRQPTLIVAGLDDPIIPVINARVMNRLLPRSKLYLHSGGHIDIVANAAEPAQVLVVARDARCAKAAAGGRAGAGAGLAKRPAASASPAEG